MRSVRSFEEGIVDLDPGQVEIAGVGDDDLVGDHFARPIDTRVGSLAADVDGRSSTAVKPQS